MSWHHDLPATLKFGHYTYKVELMRVSESDAQDAWGTCNISECVIRLCEVMSYERAIDALIHECLHAIFEAYHIEAERDEEYTVTRISTAMAALYRDNPALLKWLAKMSKGDRS